MPYSLDYAWKVHMQGQFELAVDICNVMLKSDPKNPAILCCRSMSNWSRGHRIEQALKDMRLAVKRAPNAGSLRHNLATILASVGDLRGASIQFTKALEINPVDGKAFYGLAQNMRFSQAQKEHTLVNKMDEAYANGNLPAEQREFAAFGLAKAYDDLGHWDKAFGFVRDANRLGARPHNGQRERRRLADLQALVEDKRLVDLPDSGFEEIAPIFIVGMPRSGTTLVESILARHKQVYGAGELMLLPEAEQNVLKLTGSHGNRNVGPDQAPLYVTPEQYLGIAMRIVKFLRAKARQEFSTFTDKLPHNSERVGLILKLFPKAKIINMRRHPLDVGLSNYFMRFNQGHGYSFDQVLIGQHSVYVAETMAAWKKLFSSKILDVSYERLVAHSEEVARRIVAFCGLEWDDRCLTPANTKRGVLTASQWQVRQPIYKSSVARWESYKQNLTPMIAAMGGMDWIENYQMASNSID